jgi:hypothetical protein
VVASLLGAPGCHLCHDMAVVVRPVFEAAGIAFVERDVRDDPETLRLYRLVIPVLLLDGAELARTRITAAELRARLAARGL